MYPICCFYSISQKWVHPSHFCNLYILYNSVNLLSPPNNSTHSHSCLNRWLQKWAHPLVNIFKLGPKCQYFVWPPLFSRTVLTLLVMEFTRASRVDTGVLFHSSMTTSRSWWLLETSCSSTCRLGMPHRCSIGFRSGYVLGQSITSTSASLARQWCPAAQSPKGGDLALLQYVGIHVGIHGSLN